MAIIGKIRQRTGILLIVIGLALFAFLLMDALSSSSLLGASGGNQNVGKINGKNVSLQQYQTAYQNYEERVRIINPQLAIDEATSAAIRQEVWDNIAIENILEPRFEDLGLSVPALEVAYSMWGPNPHPLIRQLFTNPNTGAFDPEQVRATIERKDEVDPTGEFARQIAVIENIIQEDRIKTKYSSLLTKGIYVPQFVAKDGYLSNNKTAAIRYISYPFADISDDQVSVSDADLKNYLQKHAHEYEQEASRSIEYVTFDILPSPEDSANTYAMFNELLDQFRETEDDSLFIRRNSETPYSKVYFSREQLEERNIGHTDTLFEIKEGAIVGPFLENNALIATKLIDRKLIPDSVKARHILFTYQNAAGRDTTFDLADSLIGLLKAKKVKFEAMAEKYSQDPGSKAQGGDLGYFTQGMMVKPFNDKVFFGASEGDIVKVESQFGLHVIEIVDANPATEAVRIARLTKPMRASQDTEKDIFRIAGQFEQENRTAEAFQQATAEMNLKRVPSITQNQVVIGELGSAREIAKWAFNAKVGDVEFFDLTDRFVIAHLIGKKEEGTADVEDVRVELEAKVRREKKAEKLMEDLRTQLQGAGSLDELASAGGKEVRTAADIRYTSTSIPGIGFEPNLVAAVFGSGKEGLAGPVKGETSVYVFQVTDMMSPPAQSSFTAAQRQMKNNIFNTYNFTSILEAAKEKATIKDQRYTFY